MSRKHTLSRRKVLQVTVLGAPTHFACRRERSRYRFFTAREAAIVAAICDHIIPPDDFPGAVQAGVVNFLDLQLTGHYRYLQQAYRRGIAEIDAAAQEKFGRSFLELSPGEQVELLEERQNTEFFRMIRDHTMQGYYGDPRHGGNLDAVSWKMLGIPHPPVRGRDHYSLEES